MSRNILVIGKGKPHHITEDEARKLVLKGEAIWQKRGRRIKYMKGKRFTSTDARLRDLSCFVEKDMVIALQDRDSEKYGLARVFLNQTRRNRERVRKAA